MVTYLVLTIACLLSVCYGVSNHGIRVITEDLQVGRLDPVTGKVGCTTQIKLPPTNCSFDLGKGTRGQTSSIFYANQTVFFMAQEKCSEGNGKTYIMAVMGPWCSDNSKPIVTTGHLPPLQATTTDLMDLNMAWDHTCNLVVLTPDGADSVVKVNQVSEYDGQQRFQPTWAQAPSDCKNCWKKVSGVGALDSGDYHSSWPQGEELNCGDKCTYYTVEEQLINGVAARQRAIVGRYYRQGNVVVNHTDSVQVQTLAWSPFTAERVEQRVSQFIGLGVCCTESWCHPGCANLDGHLVLISFSSKGFEVLADIGDHVCPQATRLGVEWAASPWSRGPNHVAYVYYEDTIITYDIAFSNGVIKTATKTSQSPKVDWKTLLLWANPGNN